MHYVLCMKMLIAHRQPNDALLCNIPASTNQKEITSAWGIDKSYSKAELPKSYLYIPDLVTPSFTRLRFVNPRTIAVIGVLLISLTERIKYRTKIVTPDFYYRNRSILRISS